MVRLLRFLQSKLFGNNLEGNIQKAHIKCLSTSREHPNFVSFYFTSFQYYYLKVGGSQSETVMTHKAMALIKHMEVY